MGGFAIDWRGGEAREKIELFGLRNGKETEPAKLRAEKTEQVFHGGTLAPGVGHLWG